MRKDLLGQSGPHEAEHLVALLAAESAPLVEWLVDETDVRLQLITDYRHVRTFGATVACPGQSPRCDLVADLAAAVRRREIPLALANPVTELLLNGDGAVCGALVQRDRVIETRVGARKGILAASGFAANRAMLGASTVPTLLRPTTSARAEAPARRSCGVICSDPAWRTWARTRATRRWPIRTARS